MGGKKIKANKLVEIISSIQDSYIKADDKSIIFDEILKHILEITDSEYGVIASVKKNSNGFPYLKTYAITDTSWNTTEFINLKTFLVDAFKKRKGTISNELKSYLGMPLLGLNGELIAIYGVAHRKGGYSEHLVHDLKPFTQAVSSIIESYQHYTMIENMAKYDSLTKLFNRQFASIKLNELIERHRKEKTQFYVFILDLNNFKLINDMYSTHIGDEFLVSFVKRVSNVLNNTDLFARIGGDEFLIAFEKRDHLNDFTDIASCLNQINDTPYLLDGKSISCGLTMGIACYPSGGKTKEELLTHASFALYDAKRKKQSMSFFSQKTKQFFEEIMMLESNFKHAFLKKEFYMLYQPQVHLKTGKILGLEALIRWNHPTRGLLSPDLFVPYLEGFGQSDKLNEYVLDKVLTEITAIDLGKPLAVSINISPKVTDFKQHIEHLIKIVQSKQSMLKANKISLEFEITESIFSAQKNNTLTASLRQAKKQGIRCAMDDFGIEYSSVNRLTQHPFDTVKIDKFFTQKLDKRNKKSVVSVMKALIQMSKDLSFKLIAEGPETAAQVKKLLEIGCLYGQGFYFYKPMVISQIRQLIQKQNLI